MKDIKSFFKEITDRLEVRYADTLFPPQWENLKEQRCPLCSCKLYLSRRGVYFCKSVKHKRFVIREKTYKELQKKMSGI